MRVKRFITGAAVTAVAVAGVVVGGSGAGAADSSLIYYGDAAGSRIQALNNTITSALTAESAVFGGASPQVSTNSTALVKAQNVLTVGAVSTKTEIRAIPGGWQVSANSRTTGINILNGAVRVDAVDTTATVNQVNGVLTSNVTSSFVGLHIAGATVPTNIPPNFWLKVGTIAQVGINTGIWGTKDGSARAVGAGLQVLLLKPAGTAPANASIFVSQVDTIVTPNTFQPTGHANSGAAYGSKVTANVGSLIGVQSDPTAQVKVFTGGTGGHTLTSSVASVRLATGLQLGAVTDTGFGSNTTSGAFTHMTSKVASLNLFNGLIRAQAITADADASSNGIVHGSSQLVGLVIAGKPINLNVAPNTTINVLNLGQVTLNQQIRNANGLTVRALDIVLGTKRNGLPVGAEIQVAVTIAAAA
ncbi:MAG: hypothetical protein QOC66_2799 [Pseudonocardiales bacterium]|nr:hypothetical protein [Pseudonocardiales bacterium]